MPIGFHVSKNGRRMPVAIREDLEYLKSSGIKYPCVQIFVSGPQNFNETLTAEDKAEIRNILAQESLPLVIHGAYVDHPWTRNLASIENIKKELTICHQIGGTGVVVHLGAGANDDGNLKFVLDKLADLPSDIKRQCVLWLEIHSARPSANTFETPTKLGVLFNRIRRITGDPAENPDALRVGLCIDSAHLFSCGFAMDTHEVTSKWIEDTIGALPRSTPIMMHFNDSGSTLASGRDLHAALARGNIWKAYDPKTGYLKTEDSGLIAILEWAESNDIVLILERDAEGLSKDLELIRLLGYFN